MATIILPDQQKLEGFDDSIAGDDQMLKDALSQYVPEIRNAKLNRTTKDGLMTVSVVKQSGTKGADFEAMLERALLISRARILKADIEQYFADIASWNENFRPNSEDYFDADPDGTLRKTLSSINSMLEREDA
jgi:hypothetical protein